MSTSSISRSGCKLLLASCFLLALSGNSVAAQSPQAPPAEEEQAQSRTQVEVLEAQLETMRQYDQRLLETVNLALGVVVTVSLTIIALNLFNYRHDKDALSKNLEETKRLLHQELQKEITVLAQNQQKILQNQLSEIQHSLLDDLNQKLAIIESEFDRRLASISSKIESESKDLNKKDKNNQYNILELEAEIATLKKLPDLALAISLRAAKLAKELGHDWRISKNLEKMWRCLEKESDLYLGDASDITEFLDGLPSKHSIEAEAIRKLLQKHRRT